MNLTELQLDRNLYKIDTKGDTVDSAENAVTSVPVPTATLQSGDAANDVNTNSKNIIADRIDSGVISSKIIYLAVNPGDGDTFFSANKLDFTNTDAGFILGIDDSAGGVAKFFVGNATNYLNWDGSQLVIKGIFSIGGTTVTIDPLQDIQTNLNLIDSLGGGTLFLQNGTYLLTADLYIPSGVRLEGVSRDGVIIDCNNSYKVKIEGTDVYTTGTITATNGSATVVGAGTSWTTAMIGRYIFLGDLWYEIIGVTDATHLTTGLNYAGDNLAGEPCAISTVNVAGAIAKLTITNATGTGLLIQYAIEPVIDDIVIWGCGTGLQTLYVVFLKILISSVENGVNANFNYCWGWKIDFSEFSNSTTGAGVIMTNSGSGTFFDSAVTDNTGNGVTLTTCKNVTFLSSNSFQNGGIGVELVSNCNDMQFIAFSIMGNTSDGIKLTATSDRNMISTSSITGNGGWGVNIAAATCDNTILVSVIATSNSSGSLSDSGTGTLKSTTVNILP